MGKRAGNINGVADFERLRGYLDKIYLFGCYSRSRLAVIEGYSGVHLDKTKRVLEELDFMKKSLTTDENKSYIISREYKSSGQIPLADVYMLRNFFNDNDLLTYLYILSSLNTNEAGYRNNYFITELKNIQGDDTIIAKLDALESEGYIRKKADEKYVLCNKNYLSSLTGNQLKELYNLIQFASMTTYPRVAGKFLLRTIERELCKQGISIGSESPYIMRHSTNRNVLDEVLVYQLLFAMEEKKWVEVEVKSKDGYKSEYMLPIEMRIDNRLGRWYCVFVHLYDEANVIEPQIINLSRIKILNPPNARKKADIEAQNVVQNAAWDKLRALTGYEGDKDSLWQQAKEKVIGDLRQNLFSNDRKQETQTISLLMSFDDADDEKRFENEMKRFNATLQKNPDGTVECIIICSESVELIPIIRSYSPYIVDLSGSENLVNNLYKTIKEMSDNLDNIKELAGKEFEVPPLKRNETKNTNEGRNREMTRTLFSKFQNREFQMLLDFFAKLEHNPNYMQTSNGIKDPDSEQFKKIQNRIVECAQKIEHGKIDFNRICLPMSAFERDYLRFALSLPEANLFFATGNKPSLEDLESGFFDLNGESINRFDKFGKEYAYDEDTRDKFKKLHKAIQEKKLISLTFKDSNRSKGCFPWKLEYRGYDHRWWLIYCDDENGASTHRVPLDKLEKVEHFRTSSMSANPRICVNEEEIIDALNAERYKKPIVLRIIDNKNAPERCFLAFETFEAKSVRFLGWDGNDESKSGVFELTLTIHKFFKSEFIRTLLHLGAKVQYISGPKDITDELNLKCKTALDNLMRVKYPDNIEELEIQ